MYVRIHQVQVSQAGEGSWSSNLIRADAEALR